MNISAALLRRNIHIETPATESARPIRIAALRLKDPQGTATHFFQGVASFLLSPLDNEET